MKLPIPRNNPSAYSLPEATFVAESKEDDFGSGGTTDVVGFDVLGEADFDLGYYANNPEI